MRRLTEGDQAHLNLIWKVRCDGLRGARAGFVTAAGSADRDYLNTSFDGGCGTIAERNHITVAESTGRRHSADGNRFAADGSLHVQNARATP